MYFVLCISLEVEEDEETTHVTTGICVIEVVPLFHTCPRALYILILGTSLFMVELFLLLPNPAIFSIINLVFLIMEIPEGRNMERSIVDAGRCSKMSSKRSYGAKKKRFAGEPKLKRWSFSQEGSPVSVKRIESKEGRHLMWKGIDS